MGLTVPAVPPAASLTYAIAWAGRDAVAPGSLRHIEGRVGAGEPAVVVGREVGWEEGRGADAHRYDSVRQVGRIGDRECLHGRSQTFRGEADSGTVGRRQKADELLAAGAVDAVDRADRFAQGADHRAEDGGAGDGGVPVVDRLEVVEVKCEQSAPVIGSWRRLAASAR